MRIKPDITNYVVWSGILTEEQFDMASDWFANRYMADKANRGAVDLFHMSPPFREAARMARKANDEHIDRMKPENDPYNASVVPLFGMGMPILQ